MTRLLAVALILTDILSNIIAWNRTINLKTMLRWSKRTSRNLALTNHPLKKKKVKRIYHLSFVKNIAKQRPE